MDTKLKKPVDKAKRNKTIYRVITSITLILPMPVYLIISACILSITPDYVITNISGSATSLNDNFTYELVGEEHRLNIKDDKTYTIEGDIRFDSGTSYIVFDDSTIFQLTDGYHKIEMSEGTPIFVNHTNDLFSKQLKWTLPIGVIFSILAAVIVCLIIFKKMNLMRKRPRLSVMLSLGLATIILVILEMIISSMLGMFITATSMWAVYSIEYIVYHRKDLFKEKEKKNSETLQQLNEMLEEYK